MLVKFIIAIVIFTALTQACEAQSDKKTQTGEQPIAISAFPSDKGTTNAEAEKFRNSGIEFAVKLENDRAIADFTKAIELDPKYADAYSRRGAAYSNKKDDDRAIADFTKVIELDPKFYFAYINRGGIYLIKKD